MKNPELFGQIKGAWNLNKEINFTADPITDKDIDFLIETIEEQQKEIKKLRKEILENKVNSSLKEKEEIFIRKDFIKKDWL